ncbi:MAG: LPXTG cell wall anchor domain-containing protein, partial [Candidatus Diapherotrites archaeon]|nr:LPXTG cell wall anchor domain-containing protein [Candidatus Diapherotrites archaeon]
ENNKCIETITVKRPTGLITPPVEPTQKTGYNPLIAIIAVAILLAGTIIVMATKKKRA